MLLSSSAPLLSFLIQDLKTKSDVSIIDNKLIVLFEMFDFNERNYLEDADLHFLVQVLIHNSFRFLLA